MIPINPDLPFVYTDEKSGIDYLFRYLTPELESEFDKITGLLDGVKDKSDSEAKALLRQYYNSAFDLFCVGWKGNSAPEFPKEKPSRFFFGGKLGWLIDTMSIVIPKLIGLDADEIKN